MLVSCTSPGGNGPPRNQGQAGLTRLSNAVTGVATTRKALLDGVNAIQDAASALDATDAICATGRGVEARASQRKGAAAVVKGKLVAQDLPGLITSYRTQLTALADSRGAETGATYTALGRVVTDGRAEAAAIAGFATTLTSVWPQYAALSDQEKTWIRRAVTPWYRSDKEGANAYAVLENATRRFLETARQQLESATARLTVPNATQSASLAAADRVLAAQQKTG